MRVSNIGRADNCQLSKSRTYRYTAILQEVAWVSAIDRIEVLQRIVC
jgi:hypothetical protein